MSDSPTRVAPPDGTPTAGPPPPPTTPEQLPHHTLPQAIAPFGASLPVAPPGYELLEQVGKGGMGTVYRAREVAFDRDVAIKLLQDRYGADSFAARRFVEEARITGQLQHPGIPPVHHIGTTPDGRPFLAMKLIKGETLADLLAREPATRGRHVAAFAQVCQAVAFAHSRRVIHRDLKPANVMVGKFGEVQVMDWGLAKVLPADGQPLAAAEEADDTTEIRSLRAADDATQAGAVMGTPAFMAPEQAQGAAGEVDERADVFGLGAVLCVVLTGQPPYSAPTAEGVRLMSIRGETADAFDRLDASGADAELVALCKRCLAAKREDRPRTADEVAKAVLAHLTAAEERARQVELARVRGEEARSRRRVQFALAGAGLLLLGLAAFGAALTSLWRQAKGANQQLEISNGELAIEKRQTDVARRMAEGERDIANALKRLADQAKAEAERERERIAAVEYGRTIQVAYQECRDSNVAAARTLLRGTTPDRRGWEWHYVSCLCESSVIVLSGHERGVTASFSPDSSRIVTASADGTARVWDARTRTSLLTLKGHRRGVTAASFSPDGARIATAGDDGTARVWDARTGAEVLTLRGHAGGVKSVAFSSDGTRAVTASADGTARVWNAQTGLETLALEGHADWVRAASFSPDGARIATAGDDGTARVWDARTGAEALMLRGHGRGVTAASFSPDGARIATAGDDGTARVWDARTGAEVLTLRGHIGGVNAASFSPDGTRITTAGLDRRAKVWDAKTGTEVITLKGHILNARVAAFSPDGARIITASEDHTAKVWDSRPFRDSQPPDPVRQVAPPPRPR